MAGALAWTALLAGCASQTTPAATSGSETPTATMTEAPKDGDAGTVPVGVLHSLTGTMSISEVSVRDATLLAIEEINKAGGVLGKQIKPIVEDGASDWPTFAEKTKKLLQKRQSSSDLRRVDVVKPESGSPRRRTEQRPVLLPGPVRRSGSISEHLLHRRYDEPTNCTGRHMALAE